MFRLKVISILNNLSWVQTILASQTGDVKTILIYSIQFELDKVTVFGGQVK